MKPLQVTRSVIIARPIRDVFDFVADARNDPDWCAKVVSTVQSDGDGAGPGAVYAVVHKPMPGRPARTMTMTCAGWQPPSAIEWHEGGGSERMRVTYTLEELADGTRFTQTSVAEFAGPAVLAAIMRRGLGRDIARQLRGLKRRLENRR